MPALPKRGEVKEEFKDERQSEHLSEKKENGVNREVLSSGDQAKAPYGGIREATKINMQDPRIKDCFPWNDKLWYSLKSTFCSFCSQTFNSTSEMLHVVGKTSLTFSKEKHEDKVMQLAVNCTGLLELDDKTIHPFVRVHVIDMVTGKYLSKKNADAPAVSNREAASVINYSDVKPATKEIDCDFIPPFATRYCDFRVTGENRAEYYESFIINESLDSVYGENVVILFEILDYNANLILSSDPVLQENLYPVAWAYLRPLGESLVHSATKQLQLYRYRMAPSPDFFKQDFADIRTPLVFYDFNWPVHVSFCLKIVRRLSTPHFWKLPYHLFVHQ